MRAHAAAAMNVTIGRVMRTIRYNASKDLGSVYDVIHMTTGHPKAKLPRMFESTRESFPELFEDVVRVQFAGKGQRPTPCMSPTRLRKLARFMIDKKRVSAKTVKTTTTRGVVYIATAPVLLACKIGMWRGKLSQLRNRYVTAYGRDLELHLYEFDDCILAEKRMHKRFESRCIVGELYDLAGIDEYRTWLRRAERVQRVVGHRCA